VTPRLITRHSDRIPVQRRGGFGRRAQLIWPIRMVRGRPAEDDSTQERVRGGGLGRMPATSCGAEGKHGRVQ
jgi:hypothetical protein